MSNSVSFSGCFELYRAAFDCRRFDAECDRITILSVRASCDCSSKLTIFNYLLSVNSEYYKS